jgi:hypothetical protein
MSITKRIDRFVYSIHRNYLCQARIFFKDYTGLVRLLTDGDIEV